MTRSATTPPSRRDRNDDHDRDDDRDGRRRDGTRMSAAGHEHQPARPTGQATAEILDRLRRDGGRVTASRRAVIDALLSSPSHHLTAADVVDAVRADDPDFHESTVYRTLERLTDLGVVSRIHIAPGPAVFHVSVANHHHLVCDRCGAVHEAPDDLFDAVAARLQREQGFTLDPGTTTVHGLCARCRGIVT